LKRRPLESNKINVNSFILSRSHAIGTSPPISACKTKDSKPFGKTKDFFHNKKAWAMFSRFNACNFCGGFLPNKRAWQIFFFQRY